MRVIVLCEESQVVCKAFRALGHEAYSNDLQPCSGGRSDWHIQADCLSVLYSASWDLVIAHTPCTYLSNSGVRWLASVLPLPGYVWSNDFGIYINKSRFDKMQADIELFNGVAAYGKAGNLLCMENPIQHRYARMQIDSYTQIVQPWQFGHGETKATCLWLYGLPDLQPTCVVTGRKNRIHFVSPGPDRQKIRSKTYQGIADAMAAQWSII